MAHNDSCVRCSEYNERHGGAPTDVCPCQLGPAWAGKRTAACPSADRTLAESGGRARRHRARNRLA
eukprot:1675280-Prymnesium_polylepis.1